jgi:hypothetical protein
VQTLPWLVNSFFAKNEGLLPRVDWDEESKSWRDDAYNVPELPDVYPEPSNWGILPAYGVYARHVDGLKLGNVKLSCKVPDKRHVLVFDDCDGVLLDGVLAEYYGEGMPIALVKDCYRRHTNVENVPMQEYFTTDVVGFVNNTSLGVERVVVNAPAAGTPRDGLYGYPTVACVENGYRYEVATDDYPLVMTVHRPFVEVVRNVNVKVGECVRFKVKVRVPAVEISDVADSGVVYNEMVNRNYCVGGVRDVELKVWAEGLPSGAWFDEEALEFGWTPCEGQRGEYVVEFWVDDGVLKEKGDVEILVS